MRKIIGLVGAIFLVCVTFSGCAGVFVPKTHGVGWTLNWSNPISWIVIVVVIGLIITWKIISNRKK